MEGETEGEMGEEFKEHKPDLPQSAQDTISSGTFDFLFIDASPRQKSQ